MTFEQKSFSKKPFVKKMVLKRNFQKSLTLAAMEILKENHLRKVMKKRLKDSLKKSVLLTSLVTIISTRQELRVNSKLMMST